LKYIFIVCATRLTEKSALKKQKQAAAASWQKHLSFGQKKGVQTIFL
jgi:hypothetical protein